MRPTRPRAGFTTRGRGLLGSGALAAVLGHLAGSVDLLRFGLLLVAVPLLALLWALVAVRTGAGPRLERTVRPHPVTSRSVATVIVELTSSRPRRLRRLSLQDQSSPELGAHGRTVRQQTPGTGLTYRIHPTRRGRWPLGPLRLRAQDPFDTAWASRTVGGTTTVVVWPRVFALPELAGHLRRHGAAARTGVNAPSADDAALRDYRPGDDLRRVHWPTTARTGVPMVRQDEHVIHRPLTVLVDLPQSPATQEWVLDLVASVGDTTVRTGHALRVLGGRTPVNHLGDLRVAGGEPAVEALLEHLTDLRAAPPEHAPRDLADAAERAAGEPGLVLAVVTERAGYSRALADLSGTHRCWAVVVPERVSAHEPADDAAMLARDGWGIARAGRGDVASVVATALGEPATAVPARWAASR